MVLFSLFACNSGVIPVDWLGNFHDPQNGVTRVGPQLEEDPTKADCMVEVKYSILKGRFDEWGDVQVEWVPVKDSPRMAIGFPCKKGDYDEEARRFEVTPLETFTQAQPPAPAVRPRFNAAIPGGEVPTLAAVARQPWEPGPACESLLIYRKGGGTHLEGCGLQLEMQPWGIEDETYGISEPMKDVRRKQIEDSALERLVAVAPHQPVQVLAWPLLAPEEACGKAPSPQDEAFRADARKAITQAVLVGPVEKLGPNLRFDRPVPPTGEVFFRVTGVQVDAACNPTFDATVLASAEGVFAEIDIIEALGSVRIDGRSAGLAPDFDGEQ